jgi:8-oxo-dGTP pyrophosphatase MutT (NUDIX family)
LVKLEACTTTFSVSIESIDGSASPRRPQATLEQAAELVYVHAVRLDRHLMHLGAQVLQVQQGAVVRRLLHHHVVAGRHQVVEQERVGLQRAVGHDHLVGRDAVLVRDPLAQRHVSNGCAVRGHPGRVGVEGACGRGLQPQHVDDVQGRGATGERDQLLSGHGPKLTSRTDMIFPVPLPVAGALVVDDDGRIFFQMRSPQRKLFPNTWDIVGGHVEPGETALEAMRREVQEETGWQVTVVLGVVGEYTWTGDDGIERTETDFLVRVDGDLSRPQLEVDRHTSFRWLGPDDLDALDINEPVDGGALRRMVEDGFAMLRTLGV